MRRLPVLLLLLGPACSDYALNGEPPKARGEEDPTTTPSGSPSTATGSSSTTGPTTGGSSTPTGTSPPATVPCTGFDTAWDWWGSPPYDTPGDWTDPAGLPFWDPAHQLVDYSTVALPDRNIPAGFDRSYVAWFDLPDPPPPVLLDLQSDDGIWIWVNGSFAGHWGGDWQEEGCVNDNASCVERVSVPPVDVSALLLPGANQIAARVSNPVQGSWFEIGARCLE